MQEMENVNARYVCVCFGKNESMSVCCRVHAAPEGNGQCTLLVQALTALKEDATCSYNLFTRAFNL